MEDEVKEGRRGRVMKEGGGRIGDERRRKRGERSEWIMK